MVGETDLTPELSRKIKLIETAQAQLSKRLDQLDFLVKRTFEEDGELNVAQVKKQLDENKLDLKRQNESDKQYYNAYFEELNQLITANKRLVAL